VVEAMPEHDEDNLALIHRAIAGEREAFNTLVEHYAARLRWLVRLRIDPSLRARISADDVIQESMLVASQQINRLRIDNESAFWAWLCRVVEHRLIDIRRRHLGAERRDARLERSLEALFSDKQRRNGAVDRSLHADSAASPSGDMKRVEQRQSLEGALAKLPPSYQEVIMLRIVEGLGVQETARIMNRSANAVSVLLTKAVKRLGEQLTPSAGG
jgi:RNA polymerase sigma-70 factor, ECF subfamily